MQYPDILCHILGEYVKDFKKTGLICFCLLFTVISYKLHGNVPLYIITLEVFTLVSGHSH